MADQIADKKTVWIPGPMGDVTPEATAAKQAAQDSAAQAALSSGQAAQAAIEAAASAATLVHTGPLIFSHFLTRDEALRIAISQDGATIVDSGVRWVPANGDGVRDPSIVQYNGIYYICFTRPTAAGGAGGAMTNFGLVSSPDLQNFTELPSVAMPSGVVRTWAPQWFVDTDGPHVIVSTSLTAAGVDFMTYELHPTNSGMTAWSTPVEISGLPAPSIDTSVVKIDTVYHAFPKNCTTNVIEHWTSTALTGPYVHVSNDGLAGLGQGYEGAQPVPLTSGGIRIYMDAFNLVDSIVYTDSPDLVTWSTPKSVTHEMRHVGAVQVANFGILRDRGGMETVLWTATGASIPWWGTAKKPSEVFREFVQITGPTSDSGGDVFLAPPAAIGFTGIDYIEAHAIGATDVVEMCPDINSTPTIHAIVLSASEIPVKNRKLNVAWRIVGWGPATVK